MKVRINFKLCAAVVGGIGVFFCPPATVLPWRPYLKGVHTSVATVQMLYGYCGDGVSAALPEREVAGSISDDRRLFTPSAHVDYYSRVLYFANFAIRKKIAKFSTRKNFYHYINHSDAQ